MTNGLIKPSERFLGEVEPALSEYIKDPLSERRANILATAVDHHLDWTFEYYRTVDPSRLGGAVNIKSFRQQLFSQCSQLRMMNDLSAAAHHRFLTWTNDPPRTVDISTAAYKVDEGALCVPNFETRFLPAATQAVDFWRVWKD